MYTFTCGITINRKGQKPYGIVGGQSEYDQLREFIGRELPSMTDPETGERIVDRVFRREEVFPGPHTESFPDLVVVFKRDYSVTQQISNSVLKKRTASRRSGDHVREGIFVASGRAFEKKRLDREVNIVDLLPTCLELFGLPLPDELDGRILKEIFTPEYLETRRPRSGPRL